MDNQENENRKLHSWMSSEKQTRSSMQRNCPGYYSKMCEGKTIDFQNIVFPSLMLSCKDGEKIYTQFFFPEGLEDDLDAEKQRHVKTLRQKFKEHYTSQMKKFVQKTFIGTSEQLGMHMILELGAPFVSVLNEIFGSSDAYTDRVVQCKNFKDLEKYYDTNKKEVEQFNEKIHHIQKKFVCAQCGALNKYHKRCLGCKSVYYCNREHQKKHWPTHKLCCKK